MNYNNYKIAVAYSFKIMYNVIIIQKESSRK